MQINLLKKIVEKTAGLPAVRIVDLLFDKKDINEFLIAKKLELTINQTRNLLYRLSHLGILSSIRKKDKRKGWYIYFWTFNVLRSLEVLEESLVQEINLLKQELATRQQKRSYKCKICGREVNEEVALLSNFLCHECGEVFELADNRQAIEDVLKSIAKIEKELEHVRSEIAIERDKLGQKLSRSIKREEKKKKEIRKQNRETKLKLRNKTEKALNRQKNKNKKIKSAKKIKSNKKKK
jgi:transcription factor E